MGIARGMSRVYVRRSQGAGTDPAKDGDQWNHAGGFSISICAGLSLKMQPRNN